MEQTKPRLIDQYKRTLNYLRVSITDRCNLNCIYCTPPHAMPKLEHKDILRYEEILRLAGIAANLGIDKIRLTGGEPLVRKGVYEFIPKLTAIPGLKEVSITTNGIYLKENLDRIKTAGINRINVSLDTMDRDKYRLITGFDGFPQVWEGIEQARMMGLNPIKINIVPLKGINDGEYLDFARLTLEYPYHIRFIEHMPVGTVGAEIQTNYIPNAEIKAQISRLGKLIPVPRTKYDGPAARFRLEGALGEIGFISPLTHHFCKTCNRLRLTAAGHLRPCLLSDKEEDLKKPMRNGASDQELELIFLKTAFNKPRSHLLDSPGPTPSSQMSSIGG